MSGVPKELAMGMILGSLMTEKCCAGCLEPTPVWKMMTCQPSTHICQGCIRKASEELADLMPVALDKVIAMITETIEKESAK